MRFNYQGLGQCERKICETCKLGMLGVDEPEWEEINFCKCPEIDRFEEKAKEFLWHNHNNSYYDLVGPLAKAIEEAYTQGMKDHIEVAKNIVAQRAESEGKWPTHDEVVAEGEKQDQENNAAIHGFIRCYYWLKERMEK